MEKLVRNKQYFNAGVKFWNLIRIQVLAWSLFIGYELIVAVSITPSIYDQTISSLCFKATYFLVISLSFTFIVKHMEQRRVQHTHLQNQLNPHFLFNTLSFIYNKTVRIAPEGAEAVMGLSQILRYGSENGIREEKMLLTDELIQIQMLIRLYHLRLEKEETISIETFGDISQTRIPAFVLIKFVENMFKYGNLSEQNPGIIKICLTKSALRISTTNRSRNNPITEKNGSGLKVIRKRLQFYYQDSMQFNYQGKNGIFELSLQIKQ